MSRFHYSRFFSWGDRVNNFKRRVNFGGRPRVLHAFLVFTHHAITTKVRDKIKRNELGKIVKYMNDVLNRKTRRMSWVY